jgi:hypothetical protein
MCRSTRLHGVRTRHDMALTAVENLKCVNAICKGARRILSARAGA